MNITKKRLHKIKKTKNQSKRYIHNKKKKSNKKKKTAKNKRKAHNLKNKSIKVKKHYHRQVGGDGDKDKELWTLKDLEKEGEEGNIQDANTGKELWKLKDLEKWEEGQSPLGLPKVRVYKISMKKKKAKDDSETADSK